MINDIKQQLEDFKTPITLNSGAEFDHYGTLRRIDCYKDDKFFSSPNNESLIFWQLGTQRLPYFVSNIDLDTKDFLPYGLGEINYYQSWVTRLKFTGWANESTLSIDINNAVENCAKYGSAIWKKFKTKGKTDVKKCNLNRIYFDTSVEYINDSDIIEEHELTASEIRRKYPEKAEEVLASVEKTDQGKYILYEKHGYIEGEEERRHVIIAGKNDDSEVELMNNPAKDDIYFDFHVWNYSGDRWLRVGVYERLFPLQEEINTLVNQNSQANEIASLLILQGDGTTTGNVLRGLESGDILNDPQLKQLAIDNRFLNSFINQLREIEAKSDKLCMTPEVITGDAMPSGTPFRSQAQLANASKSPFKYTKEIIGERMGKYIEDNIFPDVLNDWNKGGVIEILDDVDDIKIYEELREKLTVIKELKKNPNADIETMLSEIRQRVKRMNRQLKIEKDFFKFGVGIRLNVTGENFDKAQQNDAYSNILQWIMQNPAVGNNPYFRQYAEINGITPVKMGQEEVQEIQQGSTGQTVEKPKQDALMAQVDSE